MKDILIWILVIIIIVGTTIGLFVQFAPSNVAASYWLAMSDIAIIEIIIGAYMIYIQSIGAHRHRVSFPIAMNISIFNLFLIFSAIGIVIDIVLSVTGANTVLLWLIIIRWVLFIAIITPMYFTGKTGTKEGRRLASSRNRRVGSTSKVEQVLDSSQNTGVSILSSIEQALDNLRNLKVDSKEQSLWHKTIDEVEIIRNKMRSRGSDPKISRSNEDKIENLVDELVKITAGPDLVSGEIIDKIRTVAGKIKRELS